MARYSDTITDDYGRPVPGAEIYVSRTFDKGVSELRDDSGIVISQPVVTDRLGAFAFNVDDGVYDIEVHFAGRKRHVDGSVTIGAGMRDALDVRYYGAKGGGATNDAPAFVTASLASKALRVSQGTYRLDSSPSLSGNISWRKDPGAAFSGVGSILTPDIPGFNYSPDLRFVQLVEARGTIATPATDPHAVAVFSKRSTVGDTGGLQNPALYAAHFDTSNVPNSRSQAIYAEVIDTDGGAANFIEGGRFHGIARSGAKAYGLVAYAQNDSTGLNTIAFEGEIARTTGADSLDPVNWTNGQDLDAAFLATVRIGKKPMAAYLVNPYNEVTCRVGYLVGNSFAAQGANRRIVDFAAFATVENNVPHGLYIRNATFSAISMPNDLAIRAVNAAGSAEDNILSYGTDDIVVVGEEANGVRLKGTTILTPPASAAPGANGELVIQATSNTALAFKLKGSDGVVRTATLTLA